MSLLSVEFVNFCFLCFLPQLYGPGNSSKSCVQKAARNNHQQSAAAKAFGFCFLCFDFLTSFLNSNYLFQYWQTSWLTLDKFGMLIISEVAQITHANFKVVFDTFFRLSTFTALKKHRFVRARPFLCFVNAFICALHLRSFPFSGRENPTHELHICSIHQKDRQASMVRPCLQHVACPSHSPLSRYFLLQRKQGVKSENGIDARKTFAPGPWRVLLPPMIFFRSYHLSAPSQQIFDEWQVFVRCMVEVCIR